MRGLRQALEQGAIAFVARAVAALQRALLQEGFQVVEHQQAAARLQLLEQQGQQVLDFLRRVGRALGGEDLQPVAQDVLQGGSIVQGAPQHTVEVGRHLLHEFDGQRGLADATHAQQRHQPARLTQQPALQLGQFLAAAIHRGYVQHRAPVGLRQTAGRNGGGGWPEFLLLGS